MDNYPAAAYNGTATTPLPIDFDQIQKLDVLNSITQHVETIGSEKLLSLSPYSLVVDASELDIQSTTKSTAIQTNTKTKGDSPSTRSETRQMVNEIAAIALPSLGGMLLDPIMSLIDTACVGQVSTTA